MPRSHAVFLRAISNVPMEPLRVALEALGLKDVASFGGTGNFVFSADGADERSLESRISAAVGTEAFVRTRVELSRIVAKDPFAGLQGAAMFLARRDIGEQERERLLAGGFEAEPSPVVRGSTIYFVHPTRRPGKRQIVDFASELGVSGTMRASHVVARVLRLANSDT